MDKPHIFSGSSGNQKKLLQALTRGLQGGVIAGVMLGTLGSCRGTTAPPAPMPSIALEWTPFFWAQVTVDSLAFPYAAILVETTLRPGSPPSLLQMDLAASGDMPDGFPAPRSERESSQVRRTGQLHGLLAGSPAITLRRAAAPPESLAEREIGTLGLPNYEHQGLILDIPRQRYATFPRQTDIGTALGAGTILAPIEFAWNRVVVPVEVADGQTARVLLDTGLSPFPLWTTRVLWQQLTGRGGPGRGTRQYTFTSRRGPMRFVGAPLTGRLAVGGLSLKGMEVVYLSDGPAGATLEEWPDRVDGVISPRALAPDRWLVLDIPHRRLGLTRVDNR